MYRSKSAAFIGPLGTSEDCDSVNPAGAGTTFAPSPPLPGVPLTGLLPCVVLAAEGVVVLVALELGGLVARAAAIGAARIVARTAAAMALTTAEPISSKRMERPMEGPPCHHGGKTRLPLAQCRSARRQCAGLPPSTTAVTGRWRASGIGCLPARNDHAVTVLSQWIFPHVSTVIFSPTL